MDFHWNEEQRMIREVARKFFEKECSKSLVKEMMTDEVGYLPDLWKKMAELGWLGLVFEERYGGSGGSFLDLIVLLEEMGKSMCPGPFFSSVILGGLILAEGGNNHLKEEYLSSLCRGETILTLALTEDAACWASSDIKTRAEKQEGAYLLTGRKMFIPDAHIANLIIVVACTGESERAITILAVDPGSYGYTFNALKTLSGDKQFELLFEKVQVPTKRRIGQENNGWDIIDKVWPKIIVARCAQMIGGMEEVLAMTTKYAGERHQFGVPIGSFQVIQHYCADMLIQLELVRFLTLQAAWKASANLPCKKEASMAKAFCCEAFNNVTATAHQIHGAIGFTYEHDMHIYHRYAKTWELLLGGATEHRGIVAREMGF